MTYPPPPGWTHNGIPATEAKQQAAQQLLQVTAWLDGLPHELIRHSCNLVGSDWQQATAGLALLECARAATAFQQVVQEALAAVEGGTGCITG